jgi:hypothetical protein
MSAARQAVSNVLPLLHRTLESLQSGVIHTTLEIASNSIKGRECTLLIHGRDSKLIQGCKVPDSLHRSDGRSSSVHGPRLCNSAAVGRKQGLTVVRCNTLRHAPQAVS